MPHVVVGLNIKKLQIYWETNNYQINREYFR